MRKFGWMFLFGLSLSLAAQQPTPQPIEPQQPAAQQPPKPPSDPRWSKLLQLLPGQLVEFRDKQTRQLNECLLHRIDDDALVCESDDPSTPSLYIVYPRASIDRVWAIQTVHESNRKWAWVAAVFSALGGLGCGAVDGTIGAAIGLGIGSAIGVATILKDDQTHLVSRRQLLYSYH